MSRPAPAAVDEPDRALPSDISPFIGVVAGGARTLMSCVTRVRVVGDREAVPRTGPLIVAPNHLSYADGPLVGGWLTPILGRRMHWLGKREMFALPVVRDAFTAGSVHPVDRDGGDVEVLRLALRVLEAGNVLIVFPEGTRSHTGALQEAKDGIGLLALRSGATILPVGITGTERLWPRHGFIRPGGRVTMRIGAPFTAAEVLGDAASDRRRAKHLATEAIMTRIAALLPPAYRGVYGIRPAVADEPQMGADA